MTVLDRFYPIVDSAQWVARLVPVGVKLVQLRIKDLPEPEVARHSKVTTTPTPSRWPARTRSR